MKTLLKLNCDQQVNADVSTSILGLASGNSRRIIILGQNIGLLFADFTSLVVFMGLFYAFNSDKQVGIDVCNFDDSKTYAYY